MQNSPGAKALAWQRWRRRRGRAGSSQIRAPPRIDFVTKIDFKDPKWNRDTYARIDADIDPAKEKCGWLKGKAYGVRDNEKVRALFGVEGFSFTRTKRLEDGSYRRMLREIVFYRDLETGKILDTWHNPYTNETCQGRADRQRSVQLHDQRIPPDPPSYGGLNNDQAAAHALPAGLGASAPTARWCCIPGST